jgi:lysozyme
VQANTSLKYGLKSDLFFFEQKKSATRFLFFSKKGKGVLSISLTPAQSAKNPTVMNPQGLAMLEGFEGLELCQYKDPVGNPTICYGHLITSSMPECMTKQQCVNLLMQDLAVYEQCVHNAVKVPLNSNQFSALVDFAYNLGCGSLESSTLLKLLNEGNYGAVCPQLKRWVYAGGQVFPGLVSRRDAECNLFNTPVS